MTVDDIPGAIACAAAGFDGEVVDPREPDTRLPDPQAADRRQRHMVTHYPQGAWVAEEGGDVVGVALALRHPGHTGTDRGYWGLSLLVVRPDRQAQGLGRQLLEAALTAAQPGDARVIISSIDPRAMRRYARAGFSLQPTVRALGPVDVGGLPPFPDVRARSSDNLAELARIDRSVRGFSRGPDHEPMVAMARTLAVVPGRGYAWISDRRPLSLFATDEEAATQLLAASLAGFGQDTDEPRSEVLWLRAGQDWAVTTCLAAGLALQPYGPIFTADYDLPPTAIPNGAYL